VVAESRAVLALGTDNRKSRTAPGVLISAIGGDRYGALYAIVVAPKEDRSVISLIRLDASGVVTNLGKIRLPLRRAGKEVMIRMLVVTNSELGDITLGGDIAWYKLSIV
jgi:hypothetical protein